MATRPATELRDARVDWPKKFSSASMKPDDGPSIIEPEERSSLARMLLGEHAMDIASVFDWFAQDSRRAAEQTNEPRKREMFLRLASIGRPPRNDAVTSN